MSPPGEMMTAAVALSSYDFETPVQNQTDTTQKQTGLDVTACTAPV